MPTTDIASCDTTAIRERRRRLFEQLECARLDDSHPVSTNLVHEAIDSGVPDQILDPLESDFASESQLDQHAPAFVWALCKARWETNDWKGVSTLASRILATEDWVNNLGLARTIVRAAWPQLLAPESEDPSIDSALTQIREHVSERQGPLSLVADLAHYDAYRILLFEARTEDAAAKAKLAAAAYRDLGEAANECKARILGARALLIRGHLETAERETEMAVRSARSLGNARLLVHALNALGTVRFRRGDFRGALASYESGRLLAEEFDENRWLFAVEANRARVLACRGEWKEAESILAVLSQHGEGNQPSQVLAVFEEYRGLIDLAARRPLDALAHFDRCQSKLRDAGIQSYERWEVMLRKSTALLDLHRFAEAYEISTAALGHMSSHGDCLERGHLLRVQALAARQVGRPTEFRDCIDEAVTELRRCGDRHELARALLDRAGFEDDAFEERLGDAYEAVALLRRVGVTSLLKQAQDLCVQLESQRRRAERDQHATAYIVAEPRGLVAESEAMRSLLREARAIAPSIGPVLLQGETGTGKEVIARFLHEHSACASGPFLPVNCSAIPETLFEREFFGHRRGAFTGADSDAVGLVEAANGGTLFLDEVGEMPLLMQPKLLRLLQECTFRRVGDTTERHTELRIVAATNRPLLQLVADGEFREDLYYRLSCFELAIAPLRNREEDIVALTRFFLSRETKRVGQTFWLERGAWQCMRTHAWPGNIRELESAIVSACARAGEDGGIRVENLPHQVVANSTAKGRRPRSIIDLPDALERLERELILEALHRSGYSRSATARVLGIGRNTLYEKMRRLGIKPERAEPAA